MQSRKAQRARFKRFHYLFSLLSVFVIPTFVAAYFLADVVLLEELIPFVILVTIIGSIWDVWAARHGARDNVWLWQFHSAQTLGIRVLDLPIEEYLFYVASSVYVIYMWEGIRLMLRTSDTLVFVVITALAGWTLLAIFVPYVFRAKGDRFIR